MRMLLLSLFLFTGPLDVLPQQLEITDHGEMLQTIEMEKYNFPYLNSHFINKEKLDKLLNELNKKIYKEPINAKLDENEKIVHGKSGVTLDRNQFQKLFYESFYTGKPDKISIPVKEIHPRVDTDLLAEIREKQIGHYTTYFKKRNKERSHNIKLAADSINNYVVFPGEEFSFNKIVGERTKERGYKKAPVIVKGELAEDIGGGICQVSSTLYNAVSIKGIQILERYSHSRSVPYVPPGRDATVSWWGPDFVFKNLYNQPILIRAKSAEGKMDIRIFSSDSVELHKGES